jgi:very-short-patch-repair endonuclease
MLQAYLRYVETRTLADRGQITGKAADSDFEISVGRVINQLGYQIEPQVGAAGFFIDIGVRHPKRPDLYIIGVECDGAAYHSAKSARDRDRLREEILNKKGWKLHRIWSTDWFKNRPFEIHRLATALKEASERINARDLRDPSTV